LAAALGLLVSVPVAAQSIAGAWFSDTPGKQPSSVTLFLPNGYYYNVENISPADAPASMPGFERGTYTYNPVNGAFSVTALDDTNGDAGLSAVSGLAGTRIVIDGNAATVVSADGLAIAHATRVTGASPIIGGWFSGDASVFNRSLVVAFLPNDVYFLAQDGDSVANPNGMDGVEIGTYAWDAASGALSSSRAGPTYIDTNGAWGLSDAGAATASISADRLTATLGTTSGTTVLSRVGPASATPDNVIEYHHAAFDHYFITDLADEIKKLDAGVFVGWSRTGRTFRDYPLNTIGAHNVCRFFSTSFGPKSSHFYTPFASECGIVQHNPNWQFEGAVFAMALPDNEGECRAGTLPLYRLYNDGQGNAPNHRYTVSVVVRASMMAAGWIPEGSGADGVIGCVPV
jgi:hypothetical protein